MHEDNLKSQQEVRTKCANEKSEVLPISRITAEAQRAAYQESIKQIFKKSKTSVSNANSSRQAVTKASGRCFGADQTNSQ